MTKHEAGREARKKKRCERKVYLTETRGWNEIQTLKDLNSGTLVEGSRTEDVKA